MEPLSSAPAGTRSRRVDMLSEAFSLVLKMPTSKVAVVGYVLFDFLIKSSRRKERP